MARFAPPLSEVSRRRKLALLARHLTSPSEVLEIGPGDGWFTKRLRRAGHRVTTVDLFAPADVVGDIRDWERLGLAPSGFDAVVALEVIEHVDCLGAIRSLCTEDGLILLSTPHPRGDDALRALERLRLVQRRTSPHINLTDLSRVPLPVVELQRPLGVHQVGLFRNRRGS